VNSAITPEEWLPVISQGDRRKVKWPTIWRIKERKVVQQLLDKNLQ
jgi:hypothetical protein